MIEVLVLTIRKFSLYTPLLVPSTNTFAIDVLSNLVETLAAITSCRMVLNMRTYARHSPDYNLTTMAMAYPTTEIVSGIEFLDGDSDEEMYIISSETR